MKNNLKKKTKRRWYYWLLIGFAIFITVMILLLHKPASLRKHQAASQNREGTYLTHVLSPQLYNGAQRQEPFDLLVSQEGINEAIAQLRWPKVADGVVFLVPKVSFVPNGIELLGTVIARQVELAVTIVLAPVINEQGLLNLRVARVKVGAVNITFLAKIIASRMYEQQASTIDRPDDIGRQIAASLLNNEPFEPVFEIEDKNVRVRQVKIESALLTISFVPVDFL